jgi:hypothetical protein
VVLDDQEYEAIREVAAGDGLTVSEWVRRTLLSARRSRPEGARARKLAAVRAATSHDFPTADVDRMLEEIERGYVG